MHLSNIYLEQSLVEQSMFQNKKYIQLEMKYLSKANMIWRLPSHSLLDS